MENLDAWFATETPEAMTARSYADYRAAWDIRNRQRSGRWDQQTSNAYFGALNLARDRLRKLIGIPATGDSSDESPSSSGDDVSGLPSWADDLLAEADDRRIPLQAFTTLIDAELELDGNLDAVSPIAEVALRLYPSHVIPHNSLAFKLLPRWYGASGDAMALAGGVAGAHQPPQNDYVYFLMTTHLARIVSISDRGEYMGFDAARGARGFREFVDRSIFDPQRTFLYLALCVNRSEDTQEAETAMTHLLAQTPVLNRSYDRPFPSFRTRAKRIAEQIAAEAE